MKRKWNFFVVLAVLASIIWLAGCGSGKTNKSPQTSDKGAKQAAPAGEKDVASFYKGKVIQFIVPYAAGGGYDVYARMIIPYLEKASGSTIVVKNMPGGGGTVGLNELYKTKTDGLTIGFANMAGAIPAQLVKAEGVEYDLTKFNWLARVADEPQVFTVGKSSKYKNWQDIMNSKETIKVSSTGTSGSTYLDLVILKQTFGLSTFDIITGYKGTADADLAVIRGDVHGTASSLSSKINKIKNGDLKPLLLLSGEKVKALPDIPLAKEFTLSQQGKQFLDAYLPMLDLARAMMAPPGVSQERVSFLRNALKQALSNQELIAAGDKSERPINWLGGEEVTATLMKSMEAPQIFLEELKKAMK